MTEYTSCSFEGCAKPERTGGYCDGHRSQERRGMELKPLRSRASNRPDFCSFDECERAHYGHGYCEAHARQNRNGQELRPVRSYSRRVTETDQN